MSTKSPPVNINVKSAYNLSFTILKFTTIFKLPTCYRTKQIKLRFKSWKLIMDLKEQGNT